MSDIDNKYNLYLLAPEDDEASELVHEMYAVIQQLRTENDEALDNACKYMVEQSSFILEQDKEIQQLKAENKKLKNLCGYVGTQGELYKALKEH
jgi:hypothetical protein